MSFPGKYFQFSKATGRIKDAISTLPVATKEDDMEEAAAFKEEKEEANAGNQSKKENPASSSVDRVEDDADPFGLDALISKEEKPNGKKESISTISRKEDEESRIFLKLQRDALLLCLESAAKRYKTPW